MKKVDLAVANFKKDWGVENTGLGSSNEVSFDNHTTRVINAFNLKDLEGKEFEFQAMSSRSNTNPKGRVKIEGGEAYINTFGEWVHSNQWYLEDFVVDGKITYFPILMLGEYPLFVK